MPQALLQTSYFINEGQPAADGGELNGGYWEPHTSSIDFCESNYLHSNLIVEPHNVWSSLFGLSLFGILGILYGNPTNEWRTTFIYSILLVIGIGSSCLHASLHWFWQSFDELPMIYLVICALYCILEVDSPKGQTKYPYLATYLVVLSFIATIIYYTFQHLYIVFLGTFSLLTVVLFYLYVQIAWKIYNENKHHMNIKQTTQGGQRKGGGKSSSDIGVYNSNAIALQFLKWHHISYSAIAAPIWVLDQFHCEQLLPIYNNLPMQLRGMTLHVVWHICAGLGAHYFIQFLCACRVKNLGMECMVRYILGVFPVVVVVDRSASVVNGSIKRE